MPPPPRAAPAAIAVAVISFALYRATMLTGVELGDSASFQVMVGSPTISPRDAYPLYFAIADVLYFIFGGDPATTLNFVSALQGALACGVLTLVGAELSGSTAAGAA